MITLTTILILFFILHDSLPYFDPRQYPFPQSLPTKGFTLDLTLDLDSGKGIRVERHTQEVETFTEVLDKRFYSLCLESRLKRERE